MTEELDNLETTPVTTPVTANEQATEAVQEVKEEVDKRDSEILVELRAIHESINKQTEHHIRHLESHSLAQTPVQPEAVQAAGPTTETETSDEPVSLSIDEPKDLPKEKPEHTKSKKFGKRGKRA